MLADNLPLLGWMIRSLYKYISYFLFLSSPLVFSGDRVTRSLASYVCFVDRCLSFCIFSFVHCVVCSSSIYGFGLPFWYLQTLLTNNKSHMQYVYDIGKNDCTHMDGHVEVFILSLLLYSHGWTCGGIYFIIIIVLTWMDMWRYLFYHYYCHNYKELLDIENKKLCYCW